MEQFINTIHISLIMALAININDLLNKQKIESNRIEFKKGWNPASIYHSVCAFANDLSLQILLIRMELSKHQNVVL